LEPFIGIFPENSNEWYHRRQKMHNIMRLILRKYISVFNSENIIGHFDSDVYFGTLTYEENSWRINKNSYDFFADLELIFSDSTLDFISSPYHLDPPRTTLVMAKTVVEDATNFLAALSKQSENEEYSIGSIDKNLFFYDRSYHSVERTNTKEKNVVMTFGKNKETQNVFNDYSRRLPLFWSGHHPSRPLYYPPAIKTKRLRYVTPGNMFYRPKCLSLMMPMTSIDMRLHGRLHAQYLRSVKGIKVAPALNTRKFFLSPYTTIL